jgi:hypothetical protein
MLQRRDSVSTPVSGRKRLPIAGEERSGADGWRRTACRCSFVDAEVGRTGRNVAAHDFHGRLTA